MKHSYTLFFIILLFSCDSDQQTTIVENSPNAEVQRIYSTVLELMGDDIKRIDSLKVSQKAWLKLRSSHCSLFDELKNNKETKTAPVSCFEAMDKQRVKELQHARLLLLLGQQQPAIAKAYRLPFSLDLVKGHHPEKITISSDERFAAVGNIKGTTDIYDIMAGRFIRTLSVSKMYASYLRFSSNNKILITSSRSVRGMKFWDFFNGEQLFELPTAGGPFAVTKSERYIIYTNHPLLTIFDILSNRVVSSKFDIKSPAVSILLDPKGRFLVVVTMSGEIQVWDIIETDIGISLSQNASNKISSGSQSTTFALIAHEGKRLYTINKYGHLQAWKLPSLEWIYRSDLDVKHVSSFGLSKKGDLLAIGVKYEGQKTASIILVDTKTHTSMTVDDDQYSITTAQPINVGKRLLVVSTSRISTLDVPDRDRFIYVVKQVATQDIGKKKTAKKYNKKIRKETFNKIEGLSKNVNIEAVGVYEGSYPPGVQHSFRYHPVGKVKVFVGKTTKPIVLALSSNEPVKWEIVETERANIEHILLGGPGNSKVTGNLRIAVTRIGKVFSYKVGDKYYRNLQKVIKQYTGLQINSFQGVHSGKEFNIGKMNLWDADTKHYKWKDDKGVIHFSDKPK